MITFILTIVSAVVLSAAPPDSTAEKEVLAAMDAYKSACYLHADGAAMAKLLSSNLSYIHS